MQAYECVYILTPDLEEKAVEEFSEKVGELITSGEGAVTRIDIWGKRKLAYEIQGMSEGIYTVLCFQGDEKILDEMNKRFKFDNKVLRHMVVVDENPPQNEEIGSSKSDIK